MKENEIKESVERMNKLDGIFYPVMILALIVLVLIGFFLLRGH